MIPILGFPSGTLNTVTLSWARVTSVRFLARDVALIHPYIADTGHAQQPHRSTEDRFEEQLQYS
jgi:hypothetical protein